MAKIRLKRLLQEIHSRSLWQVLSVYVAGSWGVLQAVEMVQGATGLPEWILPAALVLLLIGLPVVLATAVIQGGPHLPGHRDAPEPAAGTADSEWTPPRPAHGGEESPTRFFTWRNTLLGGAGAAAVWVLLAAGWFARDYLAGGASGADLDLPLATAAESGARLGDRVMSSAADSSAPDEDAAGRDTSAVGGEAVDPGARGASATPPPDSRAEIEGNGGEGAAAPRGGSRDPGEAARAVFQAARLDADAARRAAGRLRASETAPATLAGADSAWSAGDAAAAGGRYAEATRLMGTAGRRFADAEREARAVWRERVDESIAALTAPREAADSSDARFASAVAREDDARRLADSDDLPAAVEAYAEAAELYREIPRPAPESAPPGETDPAPEPAPREIVQATLGELARALAAEDLTRVRAVWVSLTEAQASNFSTFFRRWEHIDVSFDPDWGSLETGPGELTVTVYTTWRFMEGGEAREQPPFAQTFRIIERDSRWVILDG